MTSFVRHMVSPASLFLVISPLLLFSFYFFSIAMADSALDIPIHDTYVVVPTTMGWSLLVLSVIEGLVYWGMSRLRKSPMHRGLGLLHFLLSISGLVGILVPLSMTLSPSPGRYYSYSVSDPTWDWTMIGAVLFLLGQGIFVFNLIRTFVRPRTA